MFEITAILGLVFVGLALVAIITVGGFFLKLLFKLLLIPLAIVGIVLKVVFALLFGLLLFIVAPVLLVVLLLVVIPILLVAGVLGCGWSIVAA
jgi:hypothetical protein